MAVSGRGRRELAHSPTAHALARFRAQRGAMLALYIFIAIAVAALLAPWLAPYPPAAQLDLVALRTQPPSLAHPFGTDPYSRDLLSRVLHGARISLSVALLAAAVAASMGTLVGAVAGFAGGVVDAVLMRLVDALLSIPRVLLLIAVAALWERLPIAALVLLLGFTGWFGVSRLVRAEVLALRAHPFVDAARALGATRRRVLWRHILPNAAAPAIVAAGLGVADVIVLEAGLSYLGIGVQEPLASWGRLIRDGAPLLATAPWLSIFPGLAIVITVLVVNVVADGLRQALDPRQLAR